MKKYISASLILLTFACSKQIVNPKSYTYQEPQNLNDGLNVKNISSFDADKDLIQTLTNDLIDEKLYNVHSVLIYKNNSLFYETYLCGKDENHGKNLGIVKHNANKLHDARSISKSVVSACIGIAIQKGLIQSENDPISTYFPEICKNDKKGSITIKDLLTMSSGLCWKEVGKYNKLMNDETKMDLSFNPIKFVLNKDLVNEPATMWNYNAGNTQLLAEIIKKTSGQDIEKFAQNNIFKPLQIIDHHWNSLTMAKDPAAASGLRLSSRSLLKIGILYNDSGKFNGEQILPSNWVVKSIFPHVKRPSLIELNIQDGSYGFQFWTYDYFVKNRSYKIIEAKGNGGQSVFICQELDLVVVITAGNYGEVKYNDIPHKILSNYILPALF